MYRAIADARILRKAWGLRIVLGFALLMLMLGVPFLLRNLDQLRHHEVGVRDSYAVISTIDRLLSTLLDAETVHRAFLVTGDEDYLVPLERAEASVKVALVRLRDLTSANSAQQFRVEQISRGVLAKFEDLKRVVASPKRRNDAAARALALKEIAPEDLRETRSLMKFLREEEQDRLKLREAEAQRAQGLLRTYLVSLTGLACLLLLGAYILLVRYSRDQARSAQALLKSEENYRLLSELSPMLIASMKVDGDFAYCNRAWIDYIGYSPVEQKIDWSAVVHPDDIERVSHGWQEAIEKKTDFECEVRLRRGSDGEYRWHLSRSVMMPEADGSIERTFSVNIDIHERKIIEESLKFSRAMAEQANLSKTRFLANMSHEIRTPIGVITGFLQLLKGTRLPPDAAAYVARIDRNSQQLLRLIDDILDLSKIESDKMSIERIDFSVTDLLQDLSSIMKFKARERGIEFIAETQGEIPSLIRSDPVRLRQVLSNIVGNAIKFTERGHVKLGIKFVDSRLVFRVEDTGRGISSEQAELLFQPFTQADISTTRRFGGSGLGLALSRRIARLMGGDVVLKESRVGEGSVFEIQIGVAIPEGKSAASVVSAESTFRRDILSGNSLKNLHVLLVEDSEENQLLLSLFLRRAGAHVTIAANGKEGAAMARSGQYDIVLMDMQMPIMDGIEATRLLRKQGFRNPVLALTASAMAEDRARSLAAGCDDHITKPVDFQCLVRKVAQYGAHHDHEVAAH